MYKKHLKNVFLCAKIKNKKAFIYLMLRSETFMNLGLYWSVSLITLLIVLTVYKLSSRELHVTKKGKSLKYIILVSALLIAVDILWIWSEENIINFKTDIPDKILGSSYYSLKVIAAYFSFMYSELMQLNDDEENRNRRIVYYSLMAIPAFAIVGLSIASAFTGWFFTIPENGVHERGFLYPLQNFIVGGYLFITGTKAIILSFSQSSTYSRNRFFSISLYSWLLLALGALQSIVPASVPFINIAIAISLLQAYFFIDTFEREQMTNFAKIQSFGKLFLSAYYADMKHRTLERIDVSENIKKNSDYSRHEHAKVRPYEKAINQYARNQVHSRDRHAFMEVLNLEYIREHLSKETPNYYFTYRQIDGDSYKWYRMYVVLVSSFETDNEYNALICFQNVDEEQKQIARSSYYKNMFTDAATNVYSKIIQVNISRDKVFYLKFEGGKIVQEDTGKGVDAHMDYLRETIDEEYRDQVINSCRKMIASENTDEVVSYAYKDSLSHEDGGHRWYITTIRSMEYESERILLIFITDNTEKIRSLEAQEEKIRSEKMNNFIVNVLSSAVEFRSLETGDHVNRVTELTETILREFLKRNTEYKLSEEDIRQISSAAALHDVGKIAIPDRILMKPGKLTDEEFDEMKKHPIYGCEILGRFEDKDDSFFRYCYDICRYHHERYDGRGYPEGLVGDATPIWAQIVAIVDVYDALTHNRSYKKAFPKEEAVRMINSGECGVFSPKLLECFNATVNNLST